MDIHSSLVPPKHRTVHDVHVVLQIPIVLWLPGVIDYIAGCHNNAQESIEIAQASEGDHQHAGQTSKSLSDASALPENPPAPKVRRRDSVGVEATGQICQTGAASAGGPLSTEQATKKCILQIGPKSSNWTASIQHGRNIGTSASKTPTSAQLGPNFGPAQLGSKMAQFWGPIWEQFRPNPKSAGHPFSLVVFTTFFAIDDASYGSIFPMLCFRWAQLGAKLSPKGAKLRQVRTDLDKLGPAAAFAALTVFTAFSNVFWLWWGGYGGARARPCCPHWAGLGPNFGARSHKGPSCAC